MVGIFLPWEVIYIVTSYDVFWHKLIVTINISKMAGTLMFGVYVCYTF